MKLDASIQLNLKTGVVGSQISRAAISAMRDIVVKINEDSITNVKAVGAWKTGHNAYSIAGEVSGMGVVVRGSDAEPERVVDDSKIEGAVFSTSGYGGYLETGTRFMPARPYFKPALDKNFTAEKFAKTVRENL